MNELEKIRILMVEDHFLVRMALSTIINSQPDMLIVAEAESGDQAVSLFHRHRPNITLMDLRIPGMNGLETMQTIRRDYPRAKIIVLTNYEGSEDIYRCLQAGAASYLLKDTGGDVLLEAIRAVHHGKYYLPRNVGEKLSERMPFSDLTPREIDVLQLIAKGKSNKEIGYSLKIAEKTVRIHVSNILAKLDVGDRTQAAIAALQRGIVHLD